ncbi:MAG: HAD family hydrolase [Candidatus Poseidoniales archaeon]
MAKVELVVFDMDGTLLKPRSCWAHIHDYFGTDNSDMLKMYIDRKISDQDFVKADFKLWQESTEDIVNEDYVNKILDNIEPIQGAKELVETLHSYNIRTAIISGGIQYLADKWAQKWKMERALANELRDDDNGSLSAKINVRGNAKGPVMEKLMREMNVKKNQVISIGDTVVDLPLFERSGYSIAVNTEDSRVIKNADYHHKETDLSKLIPIVKKLANY